jgi:hypothetical protein
VSLALVVEIIGDAAALDKSLKSSSGDVGAFGSSVAGAAVKVAAVAGVAVVAAGAIAAMTEAAAADRDEQNKLNAAIAAATGSTADYTAEIEAAIVAGQERAFTDSETRDALQSLVTATGDVTAATALLGPAQDIARLAGVDLATAADAVAKAQAGQDGPLRKLIPGLAAGATATDTLANATAKAAGQADVYAKSAEGMQARAGDSLGELSETIGEVFLPILDAIIPALIPILQAFGQLVKSLLPALIPLVRLVGQALGIVAGVIAGLVGWLVKLVKWIGDAIGAAGRFLDAINPLKGISLPSLPFLSSSGSPAGAGVGRSASRASSSGAIAAPSITIYTTGDGIEAEQAVVRALRRVTRINGGVIPAAGWAGAGPGFGGFAGFGDRLEPPAPTPKDG